MTSTLDRLMDRLWARWAAPVMLTVWEWADRYRVLSPEAAAEPGKWSTDRVEYAREPMACFTDPRVHTIAIQKSSQSTGTEIMLNAFGRSVHLDPGPTLMIEPTWEQVGAKSKDRVQPMIRDCEPLRGLVAPPRVKDSSNTIYHKSFPGGGLTIAGGNSSVSLASRPIRYLFIDEADRLPASLPGEGDPVALAIARTRTFRRRKIMIVSSPTVKGASRIEDWYEVSDRREYHTPCPRCGVGFPLAWEHVRWEERDPRTAHIECPGCGGRIEDTERSAMVAAGAWQARAPFAGIAGFHIHQLLTPWTSLSEQVAAFLVARHSLETRQAWTNTALGRVWEAPGETVDAGSLLLRREPYSAELPAGVVCVVAGVDVQDSYLAVLILGVGVAEESWVIAYETIAGDPARPEPWQALDTLLDRRWQHELGLALPVMAAFIDSGGHRTQSVYGYVMPRQRARRIIACKGQSGGTHGMLVSPAKPVRPASGPGFIQLRHVDVDQAKALLYSRLRLAERSGPEVIHFPMTVGEQFFSELTAEKLTTRRNKYGVPTKVWEQQRSRNEAIDCLSYALGALRLVAPPGRLQEWAARVTTAAAAQSAPASPASPPAVTSAGDPAEPLPPPPPVSVAPTGRRVWRSNYLDAHRLPTRERW